jgi:hypothetical protein
VALQRAELLGHKLDEELVERLLTHSENLRPAIRVKEPFRDSMTELEFVLAMMMEQKVVCSV